MVVIGTVKGDGMFDWHSEFMVIQARQQEIAGAAKVGRLLAEARASAEAGGGRMARGPAAGRRPARRGPGRHGLARLLLHRLGAVLVVLGRRLQDGPGLRSAS
jgi:hypothetical protein